RAVCSALWRALLFSSFSSNRTVPSETSSLSLHDALPISLLGRPALFQEHAAEAWRSLPLWSKIQFSKGAGHGDQEGHGAHDGVEDRKSTRLNSSHGSISYAVFCLKKKNNPNTKAHKKNAK